MDRERWVEIDSVLQSALERPPESRAGYLDAACHGNPDLRAQVESLLDEQEGSAEFLEAPALDMAARRLAARRRSLSGSMIGRYHVLKSIGAGGMGEVFLAEDTALKRRVALKLMQPELSPDPARVERFEFEARAASALNHPNVLVIHDIGVHEGMPFLASEYLEGQTLRRRLSEARLSRAKAIDYAIQIARGIGAAHQAGIVHRDLKPENIFLTSGGGVKLLDFGIAKLTASDTPLLREGSHGALTEPGVILGSPGYLSPEQIRGQNIGCESDIFSFGCVLYEMLTSRRAFTGKSNAEVMTSVLRDEPEIPDDVPADLARILRRCLEKEPADRFHSAADLAFVLEAAHLPGNGHRPEGPKPIQPSYLAWGTVGLLAVLLASVLTFLYSRKSVPRPVVRFEISVPGDPITVAPALAISPNGKYLAFIAMGPNGRPILWIRAMAAVAPRPVAGTEDAKYPFWSGDNRFVAFQVGDRLRSLEIENGNQRTICTIHGFVNGAWNDDNVLLVSTGSGPIVRIPFDGGPFTAVTTLDQASGERAHWWPSFLPDGKHFLYSVRASSLENGGIFAGSVDGGPGKKLVAGVITNAVYVAPGYLLYSRDGNLVARKFDAQRLQVRSTELRIADRLKAYYGYTAFSASRTGTIVFRSGDQGRYQLTWVDRNGKRLNPSDSLPNRSIESILPLAPALSPKGRMLATVRYEATNGAYGIWASTLAGPRIQFPITEASDAESPVWSPDGSRIAYSASRGKVRDLYIKRVDDAGPGALLLHSDADKWPQDWLGSNKNLLLYSRQEAPGKTHLWLLPVDGNAQPRRVSGAPDNVNDARFSPDGRWLAYSSDQSGSSLIYVQDFPEGETRLPISDRGASSPKWRADGRELFYVSAEGELMSVSLSGANDFSAAAPKELFKAQFLGTDPYAPSPDGQRFLVQEPVQDTTSPMISVILNWPTTRIR